MKDAEKERMRVGKKNRIVRYAAMLFLTAAAVFAAPQKTFAEGNKTYPTGDLKPYAPKQMENESEAYKARGVDYKGSDYQLYTTLEERVKTAMLAEEDWVDISDLNIRTDTYDLSYFYGYSPYFPSELWKISAWYGNTYYTELEIDNSFGTVEETQEVFQNVDRKLASIYKLVNNSMSEEQKAITIHDYLVSHAEYDYSYSNYTSYGVLMEGSGVCQSYAFAYMYIMNHLGIETHFLASDPMNHSWDMIKIDGSYYNVDCTFDDPTWNGGDRFGAAEHTYFLRSTSEMENLGHTFQTKPYSCTSTKYSNVFWRNVESPVYFQSGKAYFIENKSLNSYTLSDGTKKKLYTDLPYYYVSLARNGDFLYYNTEQNIYQYSIANGNVENFYELSSSEISGELQGLMIESSTLYMEVYSEENGYNYYYMDLDSELNGWSQTADGWVYYKNGTKLTGWQWLDKNWYLFGSDGIMKTGWQKDGGKWYYLNKSGAMQKGWQKLGGKWYYLNNSGVMLTGWQKIEGKWYYLNKDGVMQTGWQKISGAWYYLNKDGVMQTNWQKIGGTWYYLDSSGMMKTGWQKVSEKWYYLDGKGVMQTSKWIDGTYYVKADGTMAVSEWVDQNKYYVDANGKWVKNKTK